LFGEEMKSESEGNISECKIIIKQMKCLMPVTIPSSGKSLIAKLLTELEKEVNIPHFKVIVLSSDEIRYKSMLKF